MVEIRFTTGRQYSMTEDQVITARRRDDGTVIFKDHVRGIHGLLEGEYDPELYDGLQDFVMFKYDRGAYGWDPMNESQNLTK